MGFVTANPLDEEKAVEVEFPVDTGAVYSLMPEDKLKEINVKPRGRRRFRQVSGRGITREAGEARFRYGENESVSPVTFGRKNDRLLLGAVTLEVLGLEVDSESRTPKPTPLQKMGGRDV